MHRSLEQRMADSHERTSFRDSWQIQRGLHQGFKGQSGEGPPWRLRCLGISMKAMYRRKRSLFWNLLICCTDLFNTFFLIDSLTLLFGQTMYVEELSWCKIHEFFVHKSGLMRRTCHSMPVFAERGRNRPPLLTRVDPDTTKCGVSMCPHFLAISRWLSRWSRSRNVYLSTSCKRGAKQTNSKWQNI